MRSRGALSLFLVLLVSSPGCSYLFVTPPHEDYGGRVIGDCTTNRAAPVIDTIFVTTNVLSAVYVAGEDNVTNKGTAVGLGLSVAALWLSSAIYGYYNTSRCSELLEDDSPYSRPLPRRPVARPTWQPMPPPAPPPAPPASPPPPEAAPADEVTPPPPPAAPQSGDEEDPSQRRGRPPGGGTGRPDVTPRYGN